MYNSLLAGEYEQTLKSTACAFPKYRDRGWSWAQVIDRDPDYARWIAGNIEDLDDDLRDAIEWGCANR